MAGRTYKYNPDKDQFKEYRKDEMVSEVWQQLERARREKNAYPRQAFIDCVIKYQNEYSPSKAVKYIGYKYLGEYTYLDVFGEDAKKEDKADKHYAQSISLEEKVEQLQMQLEDMQHLLINMAKMINNQNKHQTTNCSKTA